MTTQIPPVPSGYVRRRSTAEAFAQSLGPFRHLVPALAKAFAAVARVASRLSWNMERRRERARMVGELASLSDHTLRDIGIDRSGIRSAVLDIEKGVDPRAR